MKTTEQFLSDLDNLNIKLWLDGDRLRCNAPKDALTSELKAELQTRKEEILHLIRQINSLSSTNQGTIGPVSRPENIPLSFAQQRLWFLAQLEPESPFYNEAAALRLSGQLNISIFKQSLKELFRRHEPLRTTFGTDSKGKPVQTIHPAAEISLPIVNLEQLNLTIQQQEQEIEKLVTQEAEKVFNLEQDLLFRVTLLKLNSLEHIVLLTTHHIISDGWSIGILIQELSSLYSAFCAGESSPLAELPIQYADFALWQRKWLSGEVLKTQLGYWQHQLQGAPELLQLPTDRPRPIEQTYRGATQSFRLNSELTQKLQSLSRESGSTLFMILLVGFATLLYRYSGQTDISIGSPIANRNRSEIESLIGFFVNTLVLRTHFEDNPSIESLLAQVRETTLKAYEHQDVPFEKLVEVLQPQRSLSHSPLFQVMFILQNAPMEEMKLPGVTLTQLERESTVAKFDLTLSVTETESGLEGFWEYNTDLFEGSTIERMSRHFQTLLEAIVEDPQRRVSELPLLREAERQQLLIEWNDTQVDYPQDKCIHQIFEKQVEKTPDAVALVFEDQQLTYRELNTRANQLAHYLQSLGVKSEVLVGICVERSVEMVVGLLGILKAGGAYVPLDPHFPQERLSYMLADSKVEVLLSQSSLQTSLSLLEHQAQVVYLDTDWDAVGQQSQDNLEVEVDSKNLAYVIYTSGSTGKPKGVQIPQRALTNFLNSMHLTLGITEEDVLLSVTTLSFDIAALEVFLPLISGSHLVLISRDVAMDGSQLIERLSTSNVTLMQATPATWRLLLAAGWQGGKPLKVLCGGEALDNSLAADLVERGAQVWNLYGPTESTIWSAVYQLESQLKTSATEGTIPIGHPIANTQIYLLDQNLQPVPIGVAGELHIGGDGLARGYLNRPELTQEKFITNPINPYLSPRLYKTGDLARYLSDGNIECLGRIDHQVKIRGFRIELGEIESILNTHPQIQQGVVIAREDIPRNKSLVAYIVTSEESIQSDQLREFLSFKLPAYMVPNIFVPLETLPLTPNGKVDRKTLPAPDVSRSEAEFISPRNSREKTIASIYAEILKQEKIGINDNFFELGGHSLLATQVISRLREEFQIDLPLRSLFQRPTVAQLTEYITTTNQVVEQISRSPIPEAKGRKKIKL
ncbi:MAG: amino acid adenylation domain-containing protein [Cyanobacteria bacterium P01_G01_bin.39]